jgi:hypothetical protein
MGASTFLKELRFGVGRHISAPNRLGDADRQSGAPDLSGFFTPVEFFSAGKK